MVVQPLFCIASCKGDAHPPGSLSMGTVSLVAAWSGTASKANPESSAAMKAAYGGMRSKYDRVGVDDMARLAWSRDPSASRSGDCSSLVKTKVCYASQSTPIVEKSFETS